MAQCGFFLISALLLSLILSPHADLTLKALLAAKCTGFFLLYILINNEVLKKNTIIKIFIGIMTGEALLALFQFCTQSSLGIPVLGEPIFSGNTPQLAKIAWENFIWIRPYGTFAHPNVLGGFLVISTLVTIFYKNKPSHHYVKILFLSIQLFGLFTSFSRSAILAFGISMLILLFLHKKPRKKITIVGSLISAALVSFIFLSRGIPPWKDPSLLSRLTGYQESLILFWSEPMGVGWKHYTLFLDQIAGRALNFWEYQPVHNAYLLILAETGFLGFVMSMAAIFIVFKKLYRLKSIYFLIPLSIFIISFFDHYWLSSQQAFWLLIILWGVFANFLSNPSKIPALEVLFSPPTAPLKVPLLESEYPQKDAPPSLLRLHREIHIPKDSN